ncbi:MAG: selenocysteine-specific translation elongation factor, partial [Pseudomonadota bacterium]
MIVATAGHVDHGKTSLLKALTGTETDRLPEEKSRGMSIDLGFAYKTFAGDTVVGFVDVPGHERFIRNMLAGVGGIDLGLLVVAADDGVMPQTQEHFAILDLLGVKRFLIAITKIDRVDDARVEQVRGDMHSLLASAGHSAVESYPVCSPGGDGIDALARGLIKSAQRIPARSLDGFFRMAIDRAFTLKGVGLVVTGMIRSGTLDIEDKLVLSAGGVGVRARGIRAHNSVSERAVAGQRCAINIVGRGVGEDSVGRGDWLMHSELHVPTRRLDVELRVLESEVRSLKHWTPTHLHIGADHKTSRVAVLEGGNIAPGNSGLAQLVLDQDTFAVYGDRFILRDQSAQRTIAGGHVIDPYSPKRGRARSARINTLKAMNHVEDKKTLSCLTQTASQGVSLKKFSLMRNLTQVQT